MKGTISYWAGIFGAVLAVAVWTLLLILVLMLTAPYSFWRTVFLAGITLLLGAVLLYLPFLRRSCRFSLTDTYIEYQSGILYHIRRRMRCSAIMVVTEMRTPVSAFCHTRTLLISGMGGSMFLPLLREKDAEILLAVLSPAGKKLHKAEDRNGNEE